MSYPRVIPRDLFNEANLLKCYGQIYLNLEILNPENVEFEHDGEPFDVQQDDSGALTIANIELRVRGIPCYLRRPLNSRRPWPLYLTIADSPLEIDVFNEDGSFSDEMTAFLLGS